MDEKSRANEKCQQNFGLQKTYLSDRREQWLRAGEKASKKERSKAVHFLGRTRKTQGMDTARAAPWRDQDIVPREEEWKDKEREIERSLLASELDGSLSLTRS